MSNRRKASMNMKPDTPQQRLLAPYPCPTNWTVVPDVKTPDGTAWVGLQINQHTGEHWSFFDPDAAEHVGQQLIKAARLARTGLIIAGADSVPPVNGHKP